MTSRVKTILIAAAVLSVPFAVPGVNAQEPSALQNDVIPAMGLVTTTDEAPPASVDMTHPPLHLTPDRSEILELDTAVGSIVLGNPSHANILADSATRLIIVPRMQGATHMTILDQKGNVIMQRNIVVAAERKNYVRIRRGCTTTECQPTSVYYCPDNCHEIFLSDDNQSASGDSSAEANEAAISAAQNAANTGNAQQGDNSGGEGDPE